jgi:hypothetical protein
MRSLYQLYRMVNLLSIDVAIGAMICAMFFGRLLHVIIRPYGFAALGLTVWIIYTADHLRDARMIKTTASSERHAFHQRNFKTLLIAIIVAALIDAILIIFIRKPVFIGGIALTVFVALYLAFQSYLHFLKEVFVALLYTLGVLLPSVALTEAIRLPEILLMIQFFLLALLNLFIFSIYDYESDKKDKLESFATRCGKNIVKTSVAALGLIWILICGYVLVFADTDLFKFELVLVLPFIVLSLIFFGVRIFTRYNLYRVLGDGVFWLPALILLYD